MESDIKTAQKIKILIVDDNEDILLAAKMLLGRKDYHVVTQKDPKQLPTILADQIFDVILLDMNFTKDVSGGAEGFAWLKKILEIDPDAVVILITAYGDINMAVKAIKSGAVDFVLKPWQNEKLIATISAANHLRQTRNKIKNLRQKQVQVSSDINRSFGPLIGSCGEMKDLFETIKKVANADASVLILGESGTGKELVAREIHRQSSRADELVISVDLGSITESLFESEMFGHVKGSFTDAREDRVGRFETADSGTLFLDEIGNIPQAMQTKLLTVLENREVTRVGSTMSKPIDIRLISATNQPIYQMVQDGKFRQDLLYRINTIEIHLPPLRERGEDIKILASYYLKRFTDKYNRNIARFTPNAIKLLNDYHWPGNVRELKHIIERAVVMSDNSAISREDLNSIVGSGSTGSVDHENLNLESVEKQVIKMALKKYSGNISQASKELGLTRASLYRRMEKYGI